jgi:hypothetical protein
MKTNQIYQHLVDLAEKLGVDVSEQNLKISGFPVKSGICTVEGEKRIILDKHKSKDDQIDVLIECLQEFSLDDIYVIPAIRDLIKIRKKKNEA